MSEDEVEGLDEEFLYHLNRGADLLAKGELEAARTALARARELRPKDPKVLGLLGQSLYKAGRYDEAVEVYGRLVDESPVEAAAHINLGLASVKAKRYAQAVRQLEIALDLNPDHKKAMGYLGLAWLEQGDFARAREWFERAGSEQMIAKCDELLALAKPAVEAVALGDAQPEPTASAPVPSPRPAPAAGAALGLTAFAAARLVAPAGAGTFWLSGGLLAVQVRGDVLTRGEGLLAIRGGVRLVGEVKRFRGRATEKPFGVGPRRMLRASGEGGLLYRVAGARFTPLDLEGESAYFREEVVFAFEDAVAFENGRVASRLGPDLNLVHVRGQGHLLLATAGEVVTVDVSRDAPVRVPVAALVGWTGALTPRVAPLVEAAAADAGPEEGEGLAVELVGEGRALIDEGAAGSRR
ncbi:MAG TPA: tetratricopeptide repeat protein [Anaeromyxobacteraceae bacterium]